MSSHHEMREAHERSAPGGSIVYKAITLGKARNWSGAQARSRGRGSPPVSRWDSPLPPKGCSTIALPESAWRPLVSKLGYSVGFLVVVLGRQQLFTENTLTVMLPAVEAGATR